MSRWIIWIATGFGAGRVPGAPGTAGSIVGFALVLVLNQFPVLIYSLVAVLVFGVGWYCAGRMDAASDRKDHPSIVIDEISGMLIAAFLIPFHIGFLLLALVLFRLFDIMKPFPARWIEEHLPGSKGIMLDDVVAGIYANLFVQVIGRLPL